MNNPYILRHYTGNDLNFILNSWVKELQAQFPNKFIDYNIFNKNQYPITQKILNGSHCIIATNPEDDQQIYGYVVYEHIGSETMIHFVYVKAVYRSLGIGKALLMAAEPAWGAKPVLITTLPRQRAESPLGLTLTAYQLRFDPFALNRRAFG